MNASTEPQPKGSEALPALPSREALRPFLKYLIVGMLVLAIAIVGILFATAADQPQRLFGPATVALIASIAWFFLRHDKINSAVNVLAYGIWLALIGLAFMNGGVRSPNVVVFSFVILMFGWLMGARAGYASAALSALFILGFALAESMGWMTTPWRASPWVHSAMGVITFLCCAMLIGYLVRLHASQVADLHQASQQLNQQALRLDASRAELQRAQEVAAIGSWVFDITTDVLHLSPDVVVH